MPVSAPSSTSCPVAHRLDEAAPDARQQDAPKHDSATGDGGGNGTPSAYSLKERLPDAAIPASIALQLQQTPSQGGHSGSDPKIWSGDHSLGSKLPQTWNWANYETICPPDTPPAASAPTPDKDYGQTMRSSVLRNVLLNNPLTAIGETALHLGTGLLGQVAGGLAGMGTAFVQWDWNAGTDAVRSVSHALTYEPRGEMGRAATELLNYPFEKLAEGAQWAGDKTRDATGSPAAATVVNTGIQALPLLVGGLRALKSSAAKGGMGVADEAVVTSDGTANSAMGARLAEDLAAAQAKDPRIGTTLPGANAPVAVTAESNIGGRTLVDTNQTARPAALANPNKPTLISDLIPPGQPNSTMANAHAEIGLIQQAYDAGLTQGQNMTIVVRGEAVCTFCRGSTNLIAAADRAGLNSLQVVDTVTGRTYLWTRGSNGWK